MSKTKKESPYIENENRLSDILAAIQVMATYRFYKLDFKNWSMRISGDEANHDYWRKIFEEHPEFFRFNTNAEKVSLAWRRSKQRRFHVDLNKEITKCQHRIKIIAEIALNINIVARIKFSDNLKNLSSKLISL